MRRLLTECSGRVNLNGLPTLRYPLGLFTILVPTHRDQRMSTRTRLPPAHGNDSADEEAPVHPARVRDGRAAAAA